MKTAIVSIIDEYDWEPLVFIYFKYWGFDEESIQKMHKYLDDITIVYKNEDTMLNSINYVNGMSCFAAKFIRDFKVDVGGVYITNSRANADLCYDIRLNTDTNKLEIIEKG